MIFLNRRKHFRDTANPNFIIEVKTDNTGTSADDQIMLPIQGTDMVIDWGDGNSETVTQANIPNNTLVDGNNVVHTYTSAGTYEITIGNTITRVFFNGDGDRLKILEISNWGAAVWSSMAYAFRLCANMIITATDTPKLSSCTTMQEMLNLTGAIGSAASFANWDVSTITNFQECLRGTTNFNVDISSWSVSAGQNFNGMFRSAGAFKQNISSWDFTSATNFTFFLLGIDINATSTTTNYDALLNSINGQAVNDSLSFHGGNSEYSSTGENSRWQLIAVHDSVNADASGTDKSTYDGEAAGYQFWHTTEEKIYIKKSATSADWTTALNLGKSWTIVDGGLA